MPQCRQQLLGGQRISGGRGVIPVIGEQMMATCPELRAEQGGASRSDGAKADTGASKPRRRRRSRKPKADGGAGAGAGSGSGQQPGGNGGNGTGN